MGDNGVRSLIPIQALLPFENWGIDFVGPIYLASSSKKHYIIVATDYFTKWVEARAIAKTNSKETTWFLLKHVIGTFGEHKELISDRGTHFLNKTIEALTEQLTIKHRKSTPCHLQANGQVESTRKQLIGILWKPITYCQRDWDKKLYSSLWTYNVTYKTITNHIPFFLVYDTN